MNNTNINESLNSIPWEPLGLTGIKDRDGILTIDQQTELNQLQINTALELLAYLERRRPGEPFPMAAMATGIGKGKVIHELIRLYKGCVKNDARILVIAGTKRVLVTQTEEDFQKYQEQSIDEIDDSVFEEGEFQGYSVGSFANGNTDVEVTTFQTLQRRNQSGNLNHSNYDLVILDEVHNAGTKSRIQALAEFNNVVGFTATPLRY